MHRAVVPAQDPIWSNLRRPPGRLREVPSGVGRAGVGASAGWIAPRHRAGFGGAMMRWWNRAPTTPRGGPISPRSGRCWRGGVRGWRRSPSPSASAASCRRCSRRMAKDRSSPSAFALRLAPRADAGQGARGGWLRPPFARARHRAHRVPGLARARNDRPRPVRLSAGSVRLRRVRPDPMMLFIPWSLDRGGTYRGHEERSGR
jgi:hypothetical protein